MDYCYDSPMSRRRSKLSKKEPNTFALNPRVHPLSIRAYVDFDYVERLSEETKLWLSRFTDNYYAADFRDNELDFTLEQRRLVYRQKNASNRDVVSHAEGWNLLDRDVDVIGEEQELVEPTPSHLSSDTYKTTLNAYRKALDTKPKDDKRVEKLRKALAKLSNI